MHAEALRNFCNQMTEEFGLTFDTSFLEAYNDQRWWFFENIPDETLRNKFMQIA